MKSVVLVLPVDTKIEIRKNMDENCRDILLENAFLRVDPDNKILRIDAIEIINKYLEGVENEQRCCPSNR